MTGNGTFLDTNHLISGPNRLLFITVPRGVVYELITLIQRDLSQLDLSITIENICFLQGLVLTSLHVHAMHQLMIVETVR